MSTPTNFHFSKVLNAGICSAAGLLAFCMFACQLAWMVGLID